MTIGLPPGMKAAKDGQRLTGSKAKSRFTKDLNVFQASLDDSVGSAQFQISAVKRVALALLDIGPDCVLANSFAESRGLGQVYSPFSLDDSVDHYREIRSFSFRVIVPLVAGGYVDCNFTLEWHMYLEYPELSLSYHCFSYLGRRATSELEREAERPLYNFIDTILDRQLADDIDREYRGLVAKSRAPMAGKNGSDLKVTASYDRSRQEVEVKLSVIDWRKKNADAELREAVFGAVWGSRNVILELLGNLGSADEELLDEAFADRELPNPTEYYARWKIEIPEVVELTYGSDGEVDRCAAHIVRTVLAEALRAGVLVELGQYRDSCYSVRDSDGQPVTVAGHSQHILYRMYDAGERLLYVGITKNFAGRITGHASTKPWMAQVANVRLEHFHNREELEEAERHTIRDERPVHNMQLPTPRSATRPSSKSY